jgi:hypothetical protein
LLLFAFSVASPRVHLSDNQTVARQVPDGTTSDPRKRGKLSEFNE